MSEGGTEIAAMYGCIELNCGGGEPSELFKLLWRVTCNLLLHMYPLTLISCHCTTGSFLNSSYWSPVSRKHKNIREPYEVHVMFILIVMFSYEFL